MQELRIIPVTLSAEIRPKDSLAGNLLDALRGRRLSLLKGDILIVKHKVVSKSEGRLVRLDTVKTTAASRAWGKRYHVDARVIELALRESASVIRRRNGVLITETRHGFICANSGIDVSNVDGGEHALLLPEDPDRSARKLHRELRKLTGHSIPVIISDSFGRAWREGLTEAAIGVAGMHALHDYRGRRDPHGYPLRVTIDAVADELACAAGLLSSKLTRTPFVIIRGFPYRPGRGTSRSLIRPAEQDLFR
jgi:coenzyme F420-0:L-glutamate ligase / coenzyme F420-1:gamma-L-glutamate ligase